jgi:hypothetical protein
LGIGVLWLPESDGCKRDGGSVSGYPALFVGRIGSRPPTTQPGAGLIAVPKRRGRSLSATFDLRVGWVYRFPYLPDGERWQNGWSADNYVPNNYGLRTILIAPSFFAWNIS